MKLFGGFFCTYFLQKTDHFCSRKVLLVSMQESGKGLKTTRTTAFAQKMSALQDSSTATIWLQLVGREKYSDATDDDFPRNCFWVLASSVLVCMGTHLEATDKFSLASKLIPCCCLVGTQTEHTKQFMLRESFVYQIQPTVFC